MKTKLEQIQELITELKRYAPTYLKELGVATGNPEGFVCCLSPDHEDRNPSMSWYREAGIYHCFSCNSSMDIFAIANVFEQKPLYGKEFILQNVFYLAEKYGISYAHIDIEITDGDLERIRQYDLMKILESHVQKHVNEDYLNSRKITRETAKDLSIGSVNFGELTEELEELGYTREEYEKVGIDNFKLNSDKMVLIIKDYLGRPISFVSREMITQLTKEDKLLAQETIANSGRSFETKVEQRAYLKEVLGQEFNRKVMMPKYINGNASLIYNKSETIYGLSAVKKKINIFKDYIIIEGYLDFVTAYQAGIYNVGALGSASFTDEILDVLEKVPQIKRVAIALDNDDTGEKRTKTLVDRLKARNDLEKKYSVAFYKTQYKDLDEAIIAGITNLDDIYEFNSMFEYNLKYMIKHCESEREILDIMIPTILQEDSRLTREEQVTELLKYINTYTKETILGEINYRENYKSQSVSKKYEKLIDKFKTELLLDPSSIHSVTKRFTDELKSTHENIFKKKEDLFESTLLAIRRAEEQKADRTFKKIKTGFRIFDEANVVKSNVITICGRANSFKTSLFVNTAVNILNLNENTLVFYYSTDDPLEKIVNDFIACEAAMDREYCADPLYHKEYGKEISNSQKAFAMFDLYMRTMNKIERWIKEKRLIIKQSSEMITWNNFEDALAELNDDKAIVDMAKVAIIDSVNKIEVPNIQEDNQRIGFLSERTKKAAEMYGFTIIQNIELKKIPDNYLVSLQDLRGSVSATRCIMKSYACC